MYKQGLVKFALFIYVVIASGCAFFEGNPAVTDAAIGGVAGAGIGAGAGALIGDAIGSDVGTATLIGAGAGLGAGALIGVAYYNIKLNNEISDNQEQIDKNKTQMQKYQHEIETLRQDMRAETSAVEIDESRFQYIYDGPTLGQYNR
jgi:hypothetical protein